ncbi:Enoyl-CoA delta isomerase 1 [Escovopsis weberi]|uniref:Enoyl-CoA delta isomerase 1 n=1 Tax=Escovopsis weberi TaxID=150374 RepID=A0A0M9VSG4_ESCWE|nr:Enoyl-CoA delta isomerase 1 [Escovopsis weberi]
MAQYLYTVPIPPLGNHPGGSIIVTEPRPAVYLLTLTSPPDNRLTTPVCRALLTALDLVECGGHPPGVLITTSGIPKFYSNGLDLEHATQTEGFWALFYSVWARLLTFPMPTVALINGHAYAGGLMLAMAHDYRLAPWPRGFLCLNELLFGAPLKPAMASLFRAKLSPQALRAVALEARRLTGQDAVDIGLADAPAAGLEHALAFVDERGLRDKAAKGVYGTIRAELYKGLLAELAADGLDAEERRFDEDQRRAGERREFGRVAVEQWRAERPSKL